MGTKGIILDLDQTIVDTSCLQELRNLRQWQLVYNKIPETKLYPDIKTIVNELFEAGIIITIVTSSPSVYASKVLKYHGIKYHYLVDYFSVKRRKPHPEPVLKALEVMQLNADDVISYGDLDIDIISSQEAGVKAVFCKWGGSTPIDSVPDEILYFPSEILNYLK